MNQNNKSPVYHCEIIFLISLCYPLYFGLVKMYYIVGVGFQKSLTQ